MRIKLPTVEGSMRIIESKHVIELNWERGMSKETTQVCMADSRETFCCSLPIEKAFALVQDAVKVDEEAESLTVREACDILRRIEPLFAPQASRARKGVAARMKLLDLVERALVEVAKPEPEVALHCTECGWTATRGSIALPNVDLWVVECPSCGEELDVSFQRGQNG